MQEGMREAKRYLRECAALRDALGIGSHAEVRLEPLGQGEHNANFRFRHPDTGARYVLRINYASQLGLDDQVGYERAALEVLAPSGRVPRVHFSDNSRTVIERGVLVIGFCEGEHLDFARVHDVDEAARILADVHAVDVPEDCALERPGDPLCSQFEECRRLFSAYRGSPYEDAQVSTYVERFFAAAERALALPLDARDCRSVLNTEAVPSHFLIPRNGEAGHMVDWEKPIVGEPAQDIAYFTAPTTTIWDTDFIFSAHERASFVEKYWRAVDGRIPRGRFDERFAAYLAMNCLRGTTWSAAAWVEYHDPARPLKNEKTRRLLETYLSPTFLAQLERDCFAGL